MDGFDPGVFNDWPSQVRDNKSGHETSLFSNAYSIQLGLEN